MSLEEHPPVSQSQEEHLSPSTSKKPWVSPKVVLILDLDIANNAGGSGDGDAAVAHS